MKNHNMLIHYAKFRNDVVSDVPSDIYLDELGLDENEKELIIAGLPMIKNCILSIYGDIMEYAGNPSFPRKGLTDYPNSGEMMADRRLAAIYLDRVFLTLYVIASNGKYDFDRTIEVSKEQLKTLIADMPLRSKLKLKISDLQHFERFCRIEYWKNHDLTDYKKCDTVHFIFEEKELCFALRHLVQNLPQHSFFQYGDFRVYSKSGRQENISMFPESVRLKALGEEKYDYYLTIRHILGTELNAVAESENAYQGHGYFTIGLGFENDYMATEAGIGTTRNCLTASLRFSKEAFEKIPEIVELLAPNIRRGIFAIQQCSSECKFKCNGRGKAIFDEKIFAPKVLVPCNMGWAHCEIESSDDIEAIKMLCTHIKKYTEMKSKKKLR